MPATKKRTPPAATAPTTTHDCPGDMTATVVRPAPRRVAPHPPARIDVAPALPAPSRPLTAWAEQIGCNVGQSAQMGGIRCRPQAAPFVTASTGGGTCGAQQAGKLESRRMRRPDPDLPLVATRADARDAGMSDSAVGRRLRAGQWSRLRRGSFCREEFVAETRWRAEVLAVVRAHRRLLVLSHAHAARAHGWLAPLGRWGPMSFTSPVGPARRRAGSRVFVRTLPDDE